MANLPSISSLNEILNKLNQLQKKLLEITPSPETLANLPASSPETEKNKKDELFPSQKEPESSRKQPQAPAPTVSEENNLKETWRLLVNSIRQKKPLLASLLDHGKLLKKNENNIDIGFPKDSIFLESMQDPVKKKELNQVCEEFFGKKININIQILKSNSEDSKDEELALTPSQKLERIKEEARRHPLVKEALKIFGGGITEIKVIDQKI